MGGIQCATSLIEDARMQNIKSNVDPALRTAIEQTRLIRFFYENKERVVEPHDYGIQNGSFKLLSYQIGGSSSGSLPDWRWFEVDAISQIQLLDQTFPGGRPKVPARCSIRSSSRPPESVLQLSELRFDCRLSTTRVRPGRGN